SVVSLPQNDIFRPLSIQTRLVDCPFKPGNDKPLLNTLSTTGLTLPRHNLYTFKIVRAETAGGTPAPELISARARPKSEEEVKSNG
ncbi:MAG: hypothetical protein U1B77_01755, partial [Dehalococcoidales bacterium]|nr:hypothetical protein [Dehalococcoidales bacterium]